MKRILLCKPKMCGREIDFIRDALAEDWAVSYQKFISLSAINQSEDSV